MAPLKLTPVKSLSILVIIDNEIDSMSPYSFRELGVSGQLKDIAMRADIPQGTRGGAANELRMDNICCGAHGLSLMATVTKEDNTQHTFLFDAGPGEDAWERNARRLRADIGSIEAVQLSHWHRDHSGGLLRALNMIHAAKALSPEGDADAKDKPTPTIADLHPDRPAYRGIRIAGQAISMEADPTFAEIAATGANVRTSSAPHTLLHGCVGVSGMIPRETAYETGLRNGIRYEEGIGRWVDDTLVADERCALVWVRDKGLVILTGCSHGGVINAARHALALAGSAIPLYAVIGGFHLADGDAAKVAATVRDFVALDPRILLPGHCSGWRIKFELEKALPGRLAPCTVGTRFVF